LIDDCVSLIDKKTEKERVKLIAEIDECLLLIDERQKREARAGQ
jgi:hypothetical protein